MSLRFPRRPYVVFTPVIISAWFHRATSASLPSAVSNAVPMCAQSCLASFIEREFLLSVCSNSEDFDCLCLHYGINGYTLGEGTFGCAYSACPAGTVSDAGSLYNICTGRNGTVIPTHGILTVTVVHTSAASTAGHASSTTRSQASTLTSAPINSLLMATDSPPDLPQAATASAQSTPASAENPSHRLTTVQIIGITVAGIGSIILAFGLAVCLACINRRRMKRRESKGEKISFDFADDTPVYDSRYPPLGSIQIKDPRGGLGGVGVAPIKVACRPEMKQSSYASIDPTKPGNTESASSPNAEHSYPSFSATSHASPSAARKVANSPPNRPGTERQAAPLPARPASAWTQNTVFEEDSPAVQSPYAANFTSRPTRPPRLTLIGDRPRQLSTITASNSSQEGPRPPPLSLKIPVYPHRPGVGVASQGEFRELRRRPDAVSDLRKATVKKSHREPSTVPSDRTTSSTDDLIDSYLDPSESIEHPRQAQRVKASPTPIVVITPTVPESRQMRHSCHSDTSFESADPDEPTPPEEEGNRLSMVAESPISNLSYPKIPRPSNQAVPRSPRSSQSSRSPLTPKDPFITPPKPQSTENYGTTLLEKRRGDHAAHDIERRLWITGSNFNTIPGANSTTRAADETARNTKGHSRTASDNTPKRYLPRTPERNNAGDARHTSRRVSYSNLSTQWPAAATPPMQMAIKSPVWAPTITPTRRGDDLYLSVA